MEGQKVEEFLSALGIAFESDEAAPGQIRIVNSQTISIAAYEASRNAPALQDFSSEEISDDAAKLLDQLVSQFRAKLCKQIRTFAEDESEHGEHINVTPAIVDDAHLALTRWRVRRPPLSKFDITMEVAYAVSALGAGASAGYLHSAWEAALFGLALFGTLVSGLARFRRPSVRG